MPTFKLLVLVAVAACGEVDPQLPLPDAPVPPACEPETDTTLCVRTDTTCGIVTADDNCGDPRTVDCGTCAPVCGDLSFTQTPFIPDVNATGQQDVVVGASSTGTTVLGQRRAVCSGPFALILTDAIGTAPVSTDITALPGLAALDVERESAVTLSDDGLSVLGADVAGTGIAQATRSAIGAMDFVADSADFAAITVPAGGFIGIPVLSTDRLELYFTVFGGGAGVAGIYRSVRSSKAVAFPAAGRAAELVDPAFLSVTGISSDRRALFIHTAPTMIVFTRTTLGEPFVNPNAPAPPPATPGFRVRPLGDCQTLIGTCTGGCLNEETCRFLH